MTFDAEQLRLKLNQLNAPAEVRTALEDLCRELVETAAQDLVSIILFGGLARGRFRAGRSDIDLVVVLRETSAATLNSIAQPLRSAWRAVRVEPLLLSPSELPHLASLFPTKLLDIQAHHVVLYGDDPFVSLAASREEIRYRVEQELRNVGLRLRRRFVAVSDDEQGIKQLILSVIRPLAIQLSWLLQLAGCKVPETDRTAAIFGTAAKQWNLDGGLLATLAALRANSGDIGDGVALFDRLLPAVERIADVAKGLQVTP